MEILHTVANHVGESGECGGTTTILSGSSAGLHQPWDKCRDDCEQADACVGFMVNYNGGADKRDCYLYEAMSGTLKTSNYGKYECYKKVNVFIIDMSLSLVCVCRKWKLYY